MSKKCATLYVLGGRYLIAAYSETISAMGIIREIETVTVTPSHVISALLHFNNVESQYSLERDRVRGQGRSQATVGACPGLFIMVCEDHLGLIFSSLFHVAE